MENGVLRHAITRFELLVIFATIAVLLGLLLPAVQMAREATRRSNCLNNLRHIGQAMQNYASAHTSFPPGRVVNVAPLDDRTASANANSTTGNGSCFSAYAYMLPYLEQNGIYNRINFNTGPDTVGNDNVSASQPATFLCPSDSGPSKSNGGVGVTNYVLNTGTTFSVSPMNPCRAQVTGVFYENSHIRIADIADGTSQTICISEQVLSDPNDTANIGGSWNGAIPTTGFALTSGNNNSNFGPELLAYPGDCVTGNKLQLNRGNRWLYGAPGHTLYNHIRPPNDWQIDCQGGLAHSQRNFYWWSRLSHNIAAHSKHPGGVHALYCDGHAQFVVGTIELKTWNSLGSCSSSDVVGGF